MRGERQRSAHALKSGLATYGQICTKITVAISQSDYIWLRDYNYKLHEYEYPKVGVRACEVNVSVLLTP